MFALIMTRGVSGSAQDFAEPQQLLSALTPYQQQDRQGVYSTPTAMVCQALTFNTPESFYETTPFECPQSGCIIASWVRLDNRAELAAALNLPLSEPLTDPQLILAAYLKWGDQCVEHLEGDFSFVLFDPKQQRIFAARDSIGAKPFYYYCDDAVFICATTAAVFQVLKKPRLQPDEGWMARYLIGRSDSWTDTLLLGLHKLAPAHFLSVAARSPLRLQRYHQFQDDPPAASQLDPRWLTAYRETLEQSVACRLRTRYPLVSETSGGIDSSTVLGFAAHLLGEKRAQLSSHGFAYQELEPEYILKTSQFVGVRNNLIFTARPTDEQVHAWAERVISVLGLPEENGDASFHAMSFERCGLDGARVLFSGFGGDEVVTNEADLLSHELVRAKEYGALWNSLSPQGGLRLARFLRHLWYAQRPKSDAQKRFVAGFTKLWPWLLVSEQAIEKYDLHSCFMKPAEFDAPYRRINDFILNNRISPNLVSRLDNGTLLAASYKVDYRWPLLDRRLIQQYLITPSVEKRYRGIGRYLHRRAMEGLVPAEVQWKPTKNMGGVSSDVGPRLTSDMLSSLLRPHPLLAELIDTKQIAKLENQQGIPIMIKRYATNAYLLQRWLKRYYP